MMTNEKQCDRWWKLLLTAK